MTTAQSFDLDSLNAETQQITYDVPLVFNADGDPQSGLRIVGRDSPEYRAAYKLIRTQGIQKAGHRKTAIDQKTEAGAELLFNLTESNEETLALAVVVGWFGFTKGGVEAEFNKATVSAMFKKKPTWREEVTAALANNANFIKG